MEFLNYKFVCSNPKVLCERGRTLYVQIEEICLWFKASVKIMICEDRVITSLNFVKNVVDQCISHDLNKFIFLIHVTDLLASSDLSLLKETNRFL